MGKNSRNDNNIIFNYLNRNQLQSPSKSSIKEPGNLINIKTVNGNKEPAIILAYVPKQQIRRYFIENKIDYDTKDTAYSCNYSIVAHFKLDDVKQVVIDRESSKTVNSPSYTLLIIQVDSKTSYHVVTLLSESLVNMLIEVVNQSESKQMYLNKLFQLCVMQLATNDMKRAFQDNLSSQQFIDQHEVKVSQ